MRFCLQQVPMGFGGDAWDVAWAARVVWNDHMVATG